MSGFALPTLSAKDADKGGATDIRFSGWMGRLGQPPVRVLCVLCEGWGSSVIIKMKIPALSLQRAERQGQGTLVSKMRKKDWASPHEDGCGVIFEMTPNGDGAWTYHVLYRFASYKDDGQSPAAGLVMDKAGNLYGTTAAGGPYGRQQRGLWQWHGL